MPSTDDEKLQKTSMEILSELFSTFDAAPPVIVKKEKDATIKKHKKSKKKHKHKVKKEKKHKKKSKKKKRSRSSSSSSSSSSDSMSLDLAEILIKKELGEEKRTKLETDKPIKVEPDKDIKIKPETFIKNEKDTVGSESSTTKKNGDATKTTSTKEKDEEAKTMEPVKSKKIAFAKLFESTILEIKEKQEKEKDLMDLNESGECTEDEDHAKDSHISKKKHKHKKHDSNKRNSSSKHHSESKDRKRSRSNSRKITTRDRERSPHRERSRSREHRHRSKERERDKFRDDHRHRERERERDDYKHREREDKFYSREEYKYKENRMREYDDGKHKYYSQKHDRDRDADDFRNKRHRDDFYKPEEKEDKWFTRDRYRGHDRENPPFKPSVKDRIDKKKLLEIARKNAIQMMKSGNLPGALSLGPQAQEKVIAAIKSGGKSIEELTDFCKTLSKREQLGELSSVSEDNCSDSDTEMPFHHPFQIKERPSSITMNIKNATALPLKNTQERVTELRIQFPVSSGQQHRNTESEWVPVSPKKTENVVAKAPAAPAPKPVPPVAPVPAPVQPPQESLAMVPLPPGPQAFPTQPAVSQTNADIASIVSQRLTAMRKLQENPNDVQAITEMYKAQKEMNTWAESKQQIGQFTGSTGANILSQAELSSGYQAWARKDQLQTAAPVSGGMGMHLLQKMGWKPGEGLGKEKTGTLEPLLLEVKLDKKGIVAKEEQKGGKAKTAKGGKIAARVAAMQGKHPVSLLGEYASKHKLGAPQYSVCFECGPDHKKNFLFKVIINGMEYKPNVASPNKKEAKANAAQLCLQQLGILPPPSAT